MMKAEIGQDVSKAVAYLRNGKLVGIPTETVYGLAGNAFDEQVVSEIFRIKNRPSFNPLITHAGSIEEIEKFTKQIPKKAYELAEKFWPGPLTLLLRKSDIIPEIVSAGLPYLAVRIPNHPMALDLLSLVDFPLAAPSANPYCYVSPTCAAHVDDQLGKKIPYILDGGTCEVGLESTIVGFDRDEIVVYRLGGVAIEDIEKCVKMVTTKLYHPVAPGTSPTHYSAGKKMMFGNIHEKLNVFGKENTGVISFCNDYEGKHQFILSQKGDIREAAKNIFKALRYMDHPDVKLVLAELVPDIGIGKSVNDRLKRAAGIPDFKPAR